MSDADELLRRALRILAKLLTGEQYRLPPAREIEDLCNEIAEHLHPSDPENN